MSSLAANSVAGCFQPAVMCAPDFSYCFVFYFDTGRVPSVSGEVPAPQTGLPEELQLGAETDAPLRPATQAGPQDSSCVNIPYLLQL